MAKTIDSAIQEGIRTRKLAGLEVSTTQVLLVEDNGDDCNLIADMIECANGGFVVKAVANGMDALDHFKSHDVHCVILDYRLEAEDGLDILEKMKRISPFCPVIMLTGQGNEEVAAKSIKVGAADYLVKQRLNQIYLTSAIEKAMSRAALEAKIAEQEVERQRFLNVLVHDLRAPLNRVRSLGAMAAEEADRGDVDELKGIIDIQKTVAKRAVDLVETLETYALLDSKVIFQPVDLEKVAQAARGILDTVITERKAEVEIGELPKINGHEPQLVQLMQNLIQNGLKYNDSSAPWVVVESESESENADHITFVVKDNGLGIPKKHLSAIFAPLKRLWANSQYEGTGLGLAICQKTVERHGGSIWCTSIEGEGSQFHVRLPAMKHE